MLEASEWEWDLLRHDPHRLIFSIYDAMHEHIGECQLLLDDKGGCELSVLIGRKDLWHHGYGTSAVIELLDMAFNFYKLDKAWVRVPEDNMPALGLFKKMGFVHEATAELCKRRDGSALKACIMVMNAMDYGGHEPRINARSNGRRRLPVVTIAGLPGSGAPQIGGEISRLTGCRFADDEIAERLCRRLGRSMGEIEALEASYTSIWGRAFRALLAPWERYGAFRIGPEGANVWAYMEDYELPQYVTREDYLKGLKDVIAELAREGNVVLHGYAGYLFVPSDIPALHVLVTAPEGLRQQRLAEQHMLSLKDAAQSLRRADRDSLEIFRTLLGSELMDLKHYDVVLNSERLPYEAAARNVAEMLEASSRVGEGLRIRG
jgi:cytidylate kinase